jgi:hypothetical protein
MMANKQIKSTEIRVADAKPNRKLQAELDQAFMPELDSKIGKGCNIGNLVVALMNKNYSRGSPFDGFFTHSEMVQRPVPCPETGAKFMLGGTDKILHANVLPNGRIDYSSLGCGHAYLHRLDSIDMAEYGAKVRKQLEAQISALTQRLGSNGEGIVWGVRLFASSHKGNQSLLVFRLQSENALTGSATDDAKAMFVIVPTSPRMEFDAFSVAGHMVKNENYPEAGVQYFSGKAN